MSNQSLNDVLSEMRSLYTSDPTKAVRGQGFIKLLHGYLASQLELRLTPTARSAGVTVEQEATLFGSHKPKDVDVSVIHPVNGPMMIVGLRSQMSSVGNNALTYYQDIVGECISLQDRFPLATIGYVYLMPLRPIREEHEDVVIDHFRYARMYGAITGRSGHQWKSLRGIYDHFAYMVVDFTQNPPTIDEALVQNAVPKHDLRVSTFIDRMVATYKERDLFLDYFE
jgi:hypothetical protein